MTSFRRLRVPVLPIAALAALLVFAATAAAEVRTGEGTAVFTQGAAAFSPEATLVKGTASYDTSAGSAVINVTTAAEPKAVNEKGEESPLDMLAGFFQTSSECSSGVGTLASLISAPEAFLIANQYAQTIATGYLGSFEAILNGGSSGSFVLLPKTVAGTTTTLSPSSSTLVGKGFNCAFVITEGEASETGPPPGSEFMAFPIVGPPQAPVTSSSSTPTPAPAPAALSIAKAKPLTLKAGKWKTIKVKVTNTGATATATGTLKVKPAKGVLVKPASQKLPALNPGASWTVSVQVKLTKKAKKTSTLALSGLASGVSAKGSLVLKLAGS
jgi:hypothetical protein